MKTLSREVASYGITVNSLLPGFTHTKRMEGWPVPLDQLAKEIPMGRLADPSEIAALAAFLVSEKASYITGQAIACDGGLLHGL
jgi:3-oxoacyl-[acyl-carrier protein] reductase